MILLSSIYLIRCRLWPLITDEHCSSQTHIALFFSLFLPFLFFSPFNVRLFLVFFLLSFSFFLIFSPCVFSAAYAYARVFVCLFFFTFPLGTSSMNMHQRHQSNSDSRAGVSPVDAVGFGFTGTRFSSLAYSSSGDMTAAELDARTKPRARSRSEDFTPALDPSELKKGSDDCRGIERTRLVSGTSPVFLSCSRRLKPNEIQALQQVRYAGMVP